MKMKIEKQEAAEELLYDANNDPDLQQEMLNVRFLLHQYNLLSSDRIVGRDPIVHIGENVFVISPFYCNYDCCIHIVWNFFANTYTLAVGNPNRSLRKMDSKN